MHAIILSFLSFKGAQHCFPLETMNFFASLPGSLFFIMSLSIPACGTLCPTANLFTLWIHQNNASRVQDLSVSFNNRDHPCGQLNKSPKVADCWGTPAIVAPSTFWIQKEEEKRKQWICSGEESGGLYHL